MIVINKTTDNIYIRELNKTIPNDRKYYILHDAIAMKYEKFLYLIPNFFMKDIEQMKREFKNEKVVLRGQIELLKRENAQLRAVKKAPVEVIEKTPVKVIEKTPVQDLPNKKSDKRIDFLYSFHFSEYEIKDALHRLVSSIRSIKNQNVRICVSNTSKQCIWDKIKDVAPISYIHKYTGSEMYNKPLTINFGVKNFINTPYFFHSDIDLIYPPTFVATMSKCISYKNPVRVVFNNNNLGKDVCSDKFEDYEKAFRTSKDGLRSDSGIAPGNGLIHLESFKMIRGFDEGFIGYGPEDADFNFRIGYLNKYMEIDDPKVNTYHMFHPRSNYTEQYSKNCKRVIENKLFITNKLQKKKFNKRWHTKYLITNPKNWGTI